MPPRSLPPYLDDDDALMARIAEGDHRAFALLTERHLPRTVALAVRVTGSQADGEDVAQDAFSRVWVHAPRWQPGSAKLSTWLYRITMNLCIDRQRKRQFQPLEEAPEQTSERDEGFDHLHNQQVAARVNAAIDALPDRQREAMILCGQQGFSNAEAAETLELSIKAIESLLVRARRNLRESLQDIYTDVVS